MAALEVDEGENMELEAEGCKGFKRRLSLYAMVQEREGKSKKGKPGRKGETAKKEMEETEKKKDKKASL